jgi:hypothetical protein
MTLSMILYINLPWQQLLGLQLLECVGWLYYAFTSQQQCKFAGCHFIKVSQAEPQQVH